MRKLVITLACVLSFLSCDTTEEKVSYGGNLVGEVKYTGANNMDIDNVIISLRGIDDNTEKNSKRISKTGKYDFELPSGKYALNLEGNLCYSRNLPDTIMVTISKTTTKDINIEQLPSTMIILYNDIEYKSGDTITLGNAAALDIWNKYSSKSLQWNIRAYPQPPWITFAAASGTVMGGGRMSVVFSIDKGKMNENGDNYSDIILTTNDNGSFKITVKAANNRPEKAVITGSNENICPAKSVILAVNATRATTYKWFIGTTLLSGANGSTYEVKYNGTYSAIGVNAEGDGLKSDGHFVTIKTCPALPAMATISASPVSATNNCSNNGQAVTLTANADRATSYIWRRENEQLGETGNRLVVSNIGTNTYYVKGVNISGTGQESTGKIATITSCVPVNTTSVSAVLDGVNGNRINVSWGYVTSATSYKVQICNNISMNGCEESEYYREVSSPGITFEASALHCGNNYFKVIAVNRFGESSGVTVSCDKTPSVTTPSLYTQYGSLYWSYVHIEGANSSTTAYYDICRKIGDKGKWNVIATTTSTYYSDNDLSNTEPVYYKIRAYVTTNCGVAENYSNIVYL